MFSNKVYDVLKWISMVFLPALGTLYAILASLFGLPYGEEICKAVLAIGTFLGTCLGISNINYKKKNDETDKQTSTDN